MTKTQGEIESTIGEGLTRVYRVMTGKGPKDLKAYLVADMVIVRIEGAFSPTERHLANVTSAVKAKNLIRQVREELVESARIELMEMVQGATGETAISLFHDISPLADEELFVFYLDKAPVTRE